MRNPLQGIDDALGHGLERLITTHHERRLRRVGWSDALAPGPGFWAAGDPPPRSGNALRVLIDGAAALSAIADEIREARSHVHLAGWHVNPAFTLVRNGESRTVKGILSEAARRLPVRVLVWAGAPAPVLRPWRGEVLKAREALLEAGPLQCAVDARERPMHCHHEKTVIVDDRVAFVGGIDLTDLAGDRWDRPEHRARGAIGWHDVATRIEGPAAADVAANFVMRWHAVTGESLPAPKAAAPAGQAEVQVVRTIPDGMYDELPKGDFRILESYLRALQSAERFIYLENQFLWSPEVVRVLRAKLRRPPTPEFRVLLLLPAKPNSGGDDTRGQLGTLEEADVDGGRLLACTLYARGEGGRWPVYVHAKVGIVDDRWMTIGSANVNEHSLFNDTEMNVVTCDAALIRETRQRLWAEHLERSQPEVAEDPCRIIDTVWKPIAREQDARRAQGQPLTHRLTLLPGVSKRSGLLLGPLQGLVVDA